MSNVPSSGWARAIREPFTESSDEEKPFDEEAMGELMSGFKDLLQMRHEERWSEQRLKDIVEKQLERDGARMSNSEVIRRARDFIGLGIEGEGSWWRFVGPRADEATTFLGDASSHPATFAEARLIFIVLVEAALRESFYFLKKTTRALPSQVARRKTRFSPAKRRLTNIPETGNLRAYKLPKDLRLVLRNFGVRYQPQKNPRLRRLKKGHARNRFVFAYEGVHSEPIVARVNAAQAVVSSSRNWKAVCPVVIRDQPAVRIAGTTYAASTLFDWVLNNLTVCQRGFCGILAFEGHAFVYYGRARQEGSERNPKWSLSLHTLDPHAQYIFENTRKGKEGLDRVKKNLADAAKKEYPSIKRVTISKPNETCSTAKGLIRVQPGNEGSCGVASMALLLNVARILHKDWKLIHQRSHKKFCERAYNEIRIQDAVFAAQLVHN
jgi:hypothetical protein